MAYIKKFGIKRPVCGFISQVQGVLPPEKRRRNITGSTLDEFRDRVLQLLKAPTAPPPAPEPTAPIPVQVMEFEAPLIPELVEADKKWEPYAGPTLDETIRDNPKEQTAAPVSVVDLLTCINSKVLELQAVRGVDLLHAVMSPIEEIRLLRLTQQAADGLVFMEEWIRVATKHRPR
jgi:hypothetical protein